MRPPYWRLNVRGGHRDNAVVLGRKHCAGCGRWRHAVDFGSLKRPGPVGRGLRPRCHGCTRAYERALSQRMTRRQRANKRERDRIWNEGRRRQRGIPPLDPATRAKRTPWVDEGNGQWVYVGPLAFAFESSGLTANALARRMGWFRDGKPDGLRLERQLGLKPLEGRWRRYCSIERAQELCRALDIDPVEAGC